MAISSLKDEIKRINDELEVKESRLKMLKEKIQNQKHEFAKLKEGYNGLKVKNDGIKVELDKKQKEIEIMKKEIRRGINSDGKNDLLKTRREQSMSFIQLKPDFCASLMIKELSKLEKAIIEEEEIIQNKINEEKIKYINVYFTENLKQGYSQVSIRNTNSNTIIKDITRDAALYFGKVPENCILKNEKGAIWPEDSVVRDELIQGDKVKFYLELKLGLNNEVDYYQIEGEKAKNEDEMTEGELKIKRLKENRANVKKARIQKAKESIKNSLLENEQEDDEEQYSPTGVLIKLGAYFAFFAMLIFTIIQKLEGSYPYFMNETLVNLFEGRTFPLNRNFPNGININQSQVIDFGDIFNWIEYVVLDNFENPPVNRTDSMVKFIPQSKLAAFLQALKLYEKQKNLTITNYKNQSSIYLNDLNMIVGPVRFKQNRVTNSSCSFIDLSQKIRKKLDNPDMGCYGTYSLLNRDEEPFGEYMKYKEICLFRNNKEEINPKYFENSTNTSASSNNTAQARYVAYGTDYRVSQYEAETKCQFIRAFGYSSVIYNSYPIYGKMNNYGSDGFYTDIESNTTKLREFFQYMKKYRFLDQKTRNFNILFNLYNPNENLFTIVRLGFEIGASSYIKESNYFYTIHLNFHDSYFDIFGGALSLIPLKIPEIYIVLYCGVLLWGFIKKYKRKRLHLSFHNICIMAVIVLTLLQFSLEIYLGYLKLWIRYAMSSLGTRDYMDLYSVALYHKIIQYIMSFLAVLSSVVFLMSFTQGKLLVLWVTLSYSFRSLVSFGLIFFTFMLCFTILATRLYGSLLRAFKNPYTSFFSLMQMNLGDISQYNDMLEATSSVIANMFFASFVVLIVFIYMNIFSAILNDSYITTLQTIENDDSMKKNLLIFYNRLTEELKGKFDLFKRKLKKLKKRCLKSKRKKKKNEE